MDSAARAVTLGQLRVRFAMGRTAAYRRIAALIEIRLLERVKPLYAAPAVLRATAAGVRLAGYGYPVCCVSAGSVPHRSACVDVALALERETAGSHEAIVVSEREIRWAERQAQGPIASARLDHGAEGHRGLHRPDLAVVEPGRIVAVEVELTAKGRARLETIIRAWRRARWIDSVRYYAPPGAVMSGLEAAVDRSRARERVELHPLGLDSW